MIPEGAPSQSLASQNSGLAATLDGLYRAAISAQNRLALFLSQST